VGRYISLPILFIAAILQSTIVPEIRIGEGGPDLILMLVLSWMMLADMREGIVWAMVGGILQDLVNGLPTGTSALALVVVASLVNLVVGPVARSNIVVPPVVIAVGTVLYHLLLIGLFAILGRPVPIGYTLIHATLPTVVFNTILTLPVSRLMGAVYGASRPRHVTL
jgi:rod shape-determining protein MreD